MFKNLKALSAGQKTVAVGSAVAMLSSIVTLVVPLLDGAKTFGIGVAWTVFVVLLVTAVAIGLLLASMAKEITTLQTKLGGTPEGKGEVKIKQARTNLRDFQKKTAQARRELDKIRKNTSGYRNTPHYEQKLKDRQDDEKARWAELNALIKAQQSPQL